MPAKAGLCSRKAQKAICELQPTNNSINLVNLRENILPTRERAHLILEKGRDHAVRRVRLRKL